VALVITDVSEELIAAIIRMTRISELGTTLAVTGNCTTWLILFALIMEAICLSEMSVLTRATWRNIPKDGILHSRCRENLIFYRIICNLK
jgi:hypothetical protein